ncbi:ABC transporter substrate-binding protein [Aldersonia sp. NBC_00410]|uniref:ABC transporter substrate-binding protein n=1 Tax=Aldersonia sp. NBC_00410 TaxID=2975954 RepID=UPI00224CBA56|nr:ABC transporter substrate-binding protein [Aldersonia sp. NBC_00410]MCX5046495.1 ABC transporter substrate-binding protein [Aldersonia sp. NBC_00410]
MSHRSTFARGGFAPVLCIAVGALVFAGCTDNSTDESSSSGASATVQINVVRVDEIAQTVPEKIRAAKKLVVGVNVPYAPNEYKDDSGKIVGFDVDLMNAVAQVLDVTPVYTESDFDKIIPAIQAGTYDMGMSSFTDSKEREQTVDFTTYFNAGVQWAQQTGKPVDPNNACGKRVAVQSTTVEDTDDVPTKSAACLAAGKPPIDKVKFDRQDDATTALVLGKVDAMSADSPVTAYGIKQSGGKIEPAGEVFDSAPYGWPVAKGSPLAEVLKLAVQHLIDDGTYQKIAENWGVQNGTIQQSVVNGAVN